MRGNQKTRFLQMMAFQTPLIKRLKGKAVTIKDDFFRFQSCEVSEKELLEFPFSFNLLQGLRNIKYAKT